MRDLIQFDLGQATMSIMLAAADLGIGSAMRAPTTRSSRGASLVYPRTGSVPCWSRLESLPAAFSHRSSGPTGARSPTSCTAAAGSGATKVT